MPHAVHYLNIYYLPTLLRLKHSPVERKQKDVFMNAICPRKIQNMMMHKAKHAFIGHIKQRLAALL